MWHWWPNLQLIQVAPSRDQIVNKCKWHNLNLQLGEAKGADLFQKGGRTKKQAAGRGTSRYSIGIKSWPELISN